MRCLCFFPCSSSYVVVSSSRVKPMGPSNVLSMAQLRTLPLGEQVKTLMKNGELYARWSSSGVLNLGSNRAELILKCSSNHIFRFRACLSTYVCARGRYNFLVLTIYITIFSSDRKIWRPSDLRVCPTIRYYHDTINILRYSVIHFLTSNYVPKWNFGNICFN